MDLLEKTKHPSRLMGSRHHLNSTISFQLSSSYLRVFLVLASAVAAMVLLDEDVASLPWFDSFSQEALADSFGNFYIPKSVNNLLKAWLILLAIFTSLKV
jgi:hypothetical protein